MSWHWKLSSEEYGIEEFGPYDSKEEAKAGIKRVHEKVEKLNDGIERLYSTPYEECGQHEPDWSSLTIEQGEDPDGKGEVYIDVSCKRCRTSGLVLAIKTDTAAVEWS